MGIQDCYNVANVRTIISGASCKGLSGESLMKSINRRTFLMTSLAAAGSGLARASAPLGANSRIRVAVVGLRGRGAGHIRDFAQLRSHNLEVAALCDVDENILNQRAAEAEKLTGKKPQSFIDVRRLLEDKEIDVVSFATPNHWHALNTIWACQAGKDVYVEKPSSHGIWEGTKDGGGGPQVWPYRSGRLSEPQQPRRSRKPWRRSARALSERSTWREGSATSGGRASGGPKWNPFRRGSITIYGSGRPQVVPSTRNRFHYEWHWQWEYGNGDIGNQGPHQMDLARWGSGRGASAEGAVHGGALSL